MYFNELINVLNDNFPEEWDFNQFVSNEIEYFDSMTDVVRKIYRNLNLIIFSGEYVEISNEENSIHDAISPIIDRIVNEVYNSGNNEYVVHFLHSFILPFQNHSIKHLRNLCQNIESKITHGMCSIISGFNHYGASGMEDYNDFGISDEAEFFEINCEIATYDHLISVKDETLNELIIKLVSLQSEVEAHFKELLVDKCKYLIAKISEKISEDRRSYFYTFDFQDREIHNFRFEIQYFEAFWEDNFFRNNSRQEAERRIQSLNQQRDNGGAFSLADIYFLIRYYKDSNKNLIQINNLVHDYEQQFRNTEIEFSGYEKRTRELAFNYIVNNKFSFLLKNGSTWEEIIEYLEKIKVIQDETNVHNYFPYSKFLKKYTKETKQLMEEDVFNEALIDERIVVLEEVLQLLYEKFEWCRDIDFQRYILDKDSSTKQVEFEGEEMPLFLASSFVLPINYSKVLNDCNYLKRDIEDIKSHLSIYKSLNKEKKTIEKIRHDVLSSDRKQVEILGIFSAVVLFAAGEISIFKNTPSLEQASTFSLVFAYSLILFVLAIWLITRDNSSFKASKMHFSVLSFIVIATVVVFELAFDILPWF